MRVLLLCLAVALVAARGTVSSSETRTSAGVTTKIDPRTLDITDPDPNYPLSYFRFVVGKKYTYEFESKAAHAFSRLPNPDQVTPQIELEDLGLFPFTVVKGRMTLETVCLSATRKMMFQVQISNVSVECADDVMTNNSSCPYVIQTGQAMSKHKFWFTHNSKGEIIALDFHKGDSLDVRGVKQSLIYELSMTIPDWKKKERPEMFGRYYKLDKKTIATRYRVAPFTKKAHAKGTVDGVIVRKERFSSRPSTVPRFKELPPFTYRRNTWVYMVIGGDMAPSFGPAPVPTRICSLEETQIDPAQVAYDKSAKKERDPLFILSRVSLNLRSIAPGRDRSAQLLLNDTCGLSELDNYYAKHYRPRPPISFIERAATATHIGDGSSALTPAQDVLSSKPQLETTSDSVSGSLNVERIDQKPALMDSPRNLLFLMFHSVG